MKILVFTREYKHEKLPSCGGTGVFYAQFAKELVKNGHHVTVFGVNKTNCKFVDEGVTVNFTKNVFKKNPLLDLMRSLSGKISFLNKLNLYLYELELKIATKNLINYIQSNNLAVDIIETHDFDGISLNLKENGFPYVIRTHGSWTVLEKKFNYKNVSEGRKHCEKLAFEKAKNIISISKASTMYLKECFSIRPSIEINNGLHLNTSQKIDLKEADQQSIYYFGNVNNEKGSDVAVELFKLIVRDYPEVSLHFIGRVSADYKAKTINLFTNLGIIKNVFFYGYLDNHKAYEILKKANVVLFPSKGETFGLALCEVMMLEKPIICSNIDAFNDIITHQKNGYIANSTTDYLKYCVEIFENPEKAIIIGKAAREHIVDNYDFNKMINETLTYYGSILDVN